MTALFRIVTHHQNPQVAAQMWRTSGLAAIGWSRSGDIAGSSRDEVTIVLRRAYQMTQGEANYAATQLFTFRDIAKEDLIFAYQKDNIVSLVGQATRGYGFDRNNEVGDVNGPIHYAHQVLVDWWPRPRDFHRTNFYHTSMPGLVQWACLRGTIYRRGDTTERLRSELRGIPNGAGPIRRPRR